MKLYMIGNAHIDPVWLWRWQEGFQEVKATFRSALDRMQEFPDFVFTSSSTIFYEWVERNNPAMFEEIKARVAEGRWEIVGGWLIEPDCNIPSGESFVRQGLYGQRYYKEKFGKIAKVGYCPDSFGHAGSLPQILTKSGLTSYAFMRPMPNEKALPSRIFWWKSPDGSEILAYRIPYEYLTWGKDIHRYYERLKSEMTEDINRLAFFYGVGNHGGGPTVENIQSIHALNEKEDCVLEMSTLENFFDSARTDKQTYPIIQDELQHHASGCYSAHSGIKKYNRISENILLTAEKFSSVANIIQGQAYPDDFSRAWKNVLFNQFHDIMAGCSLSSAYEDARNVHGEAINIGDINLNYAIQTLSWNIGIDHEENMRPIVVFNPHAWSGKMVCEIEVRDAKDGGFKLLDDTGKPIRAQLIQSESVTGHRRLLFVAELPSMGYRTYRLYTKQENPPCYDNVTADDFTLESDKYLLEINSATGNVSRFYDRQQDVEMFHREGARLAVIEDKSDTWSHEVFKFDKLLGDMTPVYTRLVEQGPVRSTIRVRYQFNDSYVTQDFRMYHDLDYVEVNVNTDWREPLTMLKLKFPINLVFKKPTYEIPYGYIERNVNGEEEPGQAWTDCSGEYTKGQKIAGFSVANTSKYSYSFDVDEMGITILRNPVFAHHDPAKLDPEMEYKYVSHGLDSFTYAMHSHGGGWKNGRIINIAQEINVRPVIIIESGHEGSLPQAKSFLQVSNPQVIVTVVKEAEDKDGIIIRAYETHKQHGDAVINVEFMGRAISAYFSPCEIKTFKIPYDPEAEITETNLLEW
ncbi:MAG: alpha-mannosidase [Defluviitaleaceae bacterium]|nr:alpha-mannosidase [Defluviitaleaceae bacterium]